MIEKEDLKEFGENLEKNINQKFKTVEQAMQTTAKELGTTRKHVGELFDKCHANTTQIAVVDGKVKTVDEKVNSTRWVVGIILFILSAIVSAIIAL